MPFGTKSRSQRIADRFTPIMSDGGNVKGKWTSREAFKTVDGVKQWKGDSIKPKKWQRTIASGIAFCNPHTTFIRTQLTSRPN